VTQRDDLPSGTPPPPVPPLPPGAGVDFEHADFSGATGGAIGCKLCGLPITQSYFEYGGSVTCAACGGKLTHAMQSKPLLASVPLALLWGGLGGLVGAAIHFAVIAITGYDLALVAIVVGWLVGAGVRRGAFPHGGIGFQLLAVAGTYVAISLAYSSVLIKEVITNPGRFETAPSASPASADESAPHASPSKAFVALGTVLLFAPAVPVYMGMNSPLVFLIVGFALWEAWRINRRVEVAVNGPYDVARLAARQGLPHG
jgi:hypothetical protein